MQSDGLISEPPSYSNSRNATVVNWSQPTDIIRRYIVSILTASLNNQPKKTISRPLDHGNLSWPGGPQGNNLYENSENPPPCNFELSVVTISNTADMRTSVVQISSVTLTFYVTDHKKSSLCYRIKQTKTWRPYKCTFNFRSVTANCSV
jgi:hypothetical protein